MSILKTRPCGRRECSSARHRDQYLTFGRGQVDADGFWEYPCRICAEAADLEMAAAVAATRTLLAEKYKVSPENVEAYIAASPWMHHPAWPFVESEELSEKESLHPELVGSC